MLSGSLPTGSVSGRDGWGSASRDSDSAVRDADHPRGEPSPPDRRSERSPRRDPDDLRRRIETLTSQLERKDERLQSVIDHYEARHADLVRQLETRSDTTFESSWKLGIGTRLRRWLPYL